MLLSKYVTHSKNTMTDLLGTLPIWGRLQDQAWHPDAPALLATYATLFFLLQRFSPETRREASGSLKLLLACWAGLALNAIVTVFSPKVSAVLQQTLGLGMGLAMIRLTSMAVFRLLLPALRTSPPRILEDIAASIGYVALGLVQLRYAGLDLSQIVTTSAVITAVVAFSLQDTFGNLLGGVALQFDQAYEIGDWIKVDDVVGRVVDISWRATSLETRNWETVVVPNSILMKSKFAVLGKRENAPLQWRRWVWFDVSLDVLPGTVIETVNKALNDTPIEGVSNEPAPNCLLMDFQNGTARYAARYWLTDLMRDDPTDATIRYHIDASLRRQGIRIASPQHNVVMIKENEKTIDARHRKHRNERLTALRKMDLFSHLTDTELETLADRLIYAPFVAGEVITHQGAIAHWLYILKTGRVDITLQDEHGAHKIGELESGDFFGEMGLLTGAARSATVVARTNVECYRLDKASFQSILLSREELAEHLSNVLEKRMASRHATAVVTSNIPTPPRQRELLNRIRQFFGMESNA